MRCGYAGACARFLDVMNSQRLLGAILWLIASSAVAVEPAPTSHEPLGIAMEGYDYPHTVKFFDLKIEGQDLRMAFMDVRPNGSEKGVVVLFHGKNFFGAYWKETIAVLTKSGYRVIVPDQIGFGKSSKPDIHYSFHLLAENTKRLLDSIGIRQATVVGHSMGGMVATRFALMYPEFTTRLVLEDPIGLEDYREKAPYVSTEKLYEAQLAQTEEKITGYMRAYYANPKPEYDEYARVQVCQMASGEYRRLAWSAALTMQMIYEQPVVHEFALVKPSTLLVIGQQDRTAIGKDRVAPEVAATMGNYPELGRKVAKQIPNAKLVEIGQCGHIPHFEQPEKWHRALLEFLRGS
jgi:pimeloyl-ACP methyl ester carboxylesterase